MNSDRVNIRSIEKTLKRVISVCEKKDIEAWRIASGRIIRYIPSETYCLICPDSQVADFQSASAPGWQVLGEERFSTGCRIEQILEMVSGHNTSRTNWLFQQFLKINAISDSELSDDDFVLIWDSDTVPLRRIEFFEKGSGRLECYHGKEHHQPYFQTIEKLFGFGKMTDKSFIAQCLPVKVGWLRDLIGEIEERFSQPYADVVLGLLPGESGSEFSEYETIGNWVMRNHPAEITFKKRNRWLREGSRFLGRKPSMLRTVITLWFFSSYYDFVTVENWNRPVTFHRIKSALLRRIGYRNDI